MKEKKFTYRNIRHLLLIGLTLCSGSAFSQAGNVGISTPTPQKTLHVNGSLQVTREINLGGTASTAGSSGLSNQILVSQGTGNPAVWKNLGDIVGPSSTLRSFNELVTNQVLMNVSNENGASLVLGVKSGITVSNPNNIVVVYIDIDSYCTVFSSTSSISYSFLANIVIPSGEFGVIDSGVLALDGSNFSNARQGNFRSFVFRNVPVGNFNVGIYAKRLAHVGPNGTSDLFFLPGNVHIYVYEKN
ncbi:MULTISPECIES: hypothetical protein [unclassified Chryseobacterium]|uniref:hypothetical protein n=1 Tax=unclassified Chryseobacterium TaxID=2593645 RepID=UPI001AE5083E|nr:MULTISPECIES: hypothetical protein [unclassified Chryseobacterium]MBP1165632.1 hypothetical protein [Chryseobacterium sp. PvR013]MDR4894435.1 hypothetical protein [Chryseobacterium sp. CFS7]